MNLPFIVCTAREDKFGNLEIWVGDVARPTNDEKIAYIQTSQAKSDIYANCFGFDDEDLNDIQNGWQTRIELHEDYVTDIFS